MYNNQVSVLFVTVRFGPVADYELNETAAGNIRSGFECAVLCRGVPAVASESAGMEPDRSAILSTQHYDGQLARQAIN